MSKTAQLIHDVEEEKKSKKKGFATLLVSGVLATTLCMGGVFAYLTATDSVTNKFGFTDSHAIEVIEPNWDTTDADDNGIPDAADNVLPGQTIAKDPQVKNLKNFDAYMFVEISVPTLTMQLAGDETAVPHELLSYTVNDGWTEQGEAVYDAESGMTKHTYLYDTAVAGQATTTAVFDNVTTANYANGQIGANALQSLTVDGHSIQALGFDTAAAAWAAYGAQSN